MLENFNNISSRASEIDTASPPYTSSHLLSKDQPTKPLSLVPPYVISHIILLLQTPYSSPYSSTSALVLRSTLHLPLLQSLSAPFLHLPARRSKFSRGNMTRNVRVNGKRYIYSQLMIPVDNIMICWSRNWPYNSVILCVKCLVAFCAFVCIFGNE